MFELETQLNCTYFKVLKDVFLSFVFCVSFFMTFLEIDKYMDIPSSGCCFVTFCSYNILVAHEIHKFVGLICYCGIPCAQPGVGYHNVT